MKNNYRIEQISPYIREVGVQMQDSWRTLKRRIYDHQFLYCFRGSCYLTLGEEHFKIKKGDLIIIYPDTPHTLWFEDFDNSELYWFHCDFFYFEDRLWIYDFYNDIKKYATLFKPELQYREHIRENPIFEDDYVLPQLTSFTDTSEIEYIFKKFYKEYLSKDFLWHINSKIYFFEILKHIFQNKESKTKPISTQKFVTQKIKQHIKINYYKKFKMEDIYHVTGLNADYASKLFKKETGIKLSEYINKYRMDKAKKLLLEADLTIEDISEMVGFSSKNYFCSITKKLEGKSPLKLRAHLIELTEDVE